MKIIISKNKKQASKQAAEMIIKQVKKKPGSVLVLATGGTVILVYKEVVKISNKEKIDWSNVKTFNLDKYLGLKEKNKHSFRFFMDKYLFNRINIKKSNTFFPTTNFKDYESKIKKAGGIDFEVLGIGRNGHIAMNEPGSSFKSRTRVVTMNPVTRKDNSRFFHSLREIPKKGITMGISTIMSAKKIILLGFGNKKSNAIKEALEGPITKEIPASVLRKHKNTTIMIDKKAAAKLKQNYNKV